MPTHAQMVIDSAEVRQLVADGYSDWRELVTAAVDAYERRVGMAYAYVVPIPTNHATDEVHEAHAQRVWKDFWEPIISRAHVEGSEAADISVSELDQIKRELYDAHSVVHNISIIYGEVSGNRVSKPLTDPYVVAQLAQERTMEEVTQNVYDWLEVLEAEMDDQTTITLEGIKQSVLDNFGPVPTYG
jgi:predicted RNA-binding protein Jag